MKNISFLKYPFKILAGFNHWKMFLTFPFPTVYTLQLLCCYLDSLEYSRFSSKDLFNTSDSLATPNDFLNVPVLFYPWYCNLPIGSMLDLSIYVDKNYVSCWSCDTNFKPYITFKPFLEVPTDTYSMNYNLVWCKIVKK